MRDGNSYLGTLLIFTSGGACSVAINAVANSNFGTAAIFGFGCVCLYIWGRSRLERWANS